MNNSDSRTGGDVPFPEPSEEIVALYKQHVPLYLSELHAAIANDDHPSVQFHCHKMSSAMKTMGFDNIADLLEMIQREKPQGEELVKIGTKVEKLVEHTLVLLSK